MLEARAHQHLKRLLRQEGAEHWPHQLTLSRLVGRSLRRHDRTLVRLAACSGSDWLIGLLVPMALSELPLALVVGDALRQRLLQVELPRLQAAGLAAACWQGPGAPADVPLWLLSPAELIEAWRADQLGDRQLVFTETEGLDAALRRALAITIEPQHWEQLRRARPSAGESLLNLHERLSRLVLTHPANPEGLVALQPEQEAPLRQLLHLLEPLPDPWGRWLRQGPGEWSSWAAVDRDLLRWQLHRQPLEPLLCLDGLLQNRGCLMVGELGGSNGSDSPTELLPMGFHPALVVNLADAPLQDPLPLYAPLRQPLPNSPCYGTHLLEHSRRLILGQAGLTVVLIDDASLRGGLCSALAAEFGRRVTQASTAPESNGVICCSWRWWLEHQQRLPAPVQLIAALLPIASLEDPLTAARVARLRQQGRDWFRELLLPEALGLLQRSVAGLRRQGGRLAVLDGRLRSRSWGGQVLEALSPWVNLSRLLPD